MKKLAVAVTLLFCISTTAFIDQITILKRWNSELNKYNYVINCADIHNQSDELNKEQITAIEKLIEESRNGYFLFEGLPKDKIRNTSLSGVDTFIRLTIGNTLPLLERYTKQKGNISDSIESRQVNLISPILQMAFCMNMKYPVKALSDIILEPLKRINISLLKLQINYESASENSILKKDYGWYLKFFEAANHSFQKDKAFAESLASREEELVDYLATEYALEKGLNIENFKFLLADNEQQNDNRSILMQFFQFINDNFTNKFMFALIAIPELNALQKIIENQKHNIFIFSGLLHSKSLNSMLLKLGYEKVYEYKSTSDNQTIIENLLKNNRDILHQYEKNDITIEDVKLQIHDPMKEAITAIKSIPSDFFVKLAEEGFIENLSFKDLPNYESESLSDCGSNQI